VSCRRLLDAGCRILMPWGAPIGSGQGLLNPTALRTLRARLPEALLVVDAGIGSPKDAVQAMELGYDAVLVNTAVSNAHDPVKMARAFRLAVEGGTAGLRGRHHGQAGHGGAQHAGDGTALRAVSSVAMKIATFNVNGVQGRLPRLLEWLEEAATRRRLPAGDQDRRRDLSGRSLRGRGYGAIWHGPALAPWRGDPRARHRRRGEVRRGLPGDDGDAASRWLEADVHGLRIVSGVPAQRQSGAQPELRLQAALDAAAGGARAHADGLRGATSSSAGDFNVVPTNFDIYNAGSWRFDAVLQPQTREQWARVMAQGWIDATAPACIRPAHLHLLGQRGGVPTQRRVPHGLPAAHALAAAAPASRRSGCRAPGREKPSDHAPVWIRCAEQRSSETFPRQARCSAQGFSGSTRRPRARMRSRSSSTGGGTMTQAAIPRATLRRASARCLLTPGCCPRRRRLRHQLHALDPRPQRRRRGRQRPGLHLLGPGHVQRGVNKRSINWDGSHHLRDQRTHPRGTGAATAQAATGATSRAHSAGDNQDRLCAGAVWRLLA
jgi:exonuclease III